MDLYRLKIKLTSPTGSLWQSDTLFGHLCWQIVFRDGEDKLKDFLKPFIDGSPPFALSDGFPAGLLPRPLPPSGGEKIAVSVKEYREFKQRRKSPFLTVEQFHQLRRGEEISGESPAGDWVRTETLHASLDRISNRTGGEGSAGELYQTEAWLPVPADGMEAASGEPNLNIYARATDEGLETLTGLMERLAKTGYGRDKSVGLGQFRLLGIEKLDGWDDVEGANGFVSLSSFIPAPDDPTEGRWKIRVKYGKLGEHYALSEKPFKLPLLQFEPGAVFYTGKSPRGWYGRVVEGVVDSKPEIVQNCQSITLPTVWRR